MREPNDARLEVRLLGPVEAKVGGRPLPLGRRKQRALFALLAFNANRVVSTDRLIDALWGDPPPPTAPIALYGLVSSLRKLLEPSGAGALVTRAPGYVLELSAEQIDLGTFERLAADGRALLANDAEAASMKLAEALELWRGPPFQDLASFPFAQLEIPRLEDSRLAVLETRIEADLAGGGNGDLVSELESLVAEHPLRERLRGQLMRALYRDGRQAEALAAYREARTALVELGLEPSQELHELERAILRQDPALAPRGSAASKNRSAMSANGAVETLGPSRRSANRRSKWLAAAGLALAVFVGLAIFALSNSSGDRTVDLPANALAVVEHGRLVSAGSLGGSPSEVAAGAGSLWVTSADDQTVSRIDPDTGDVRQTINVGSGASGVAADDRSVWIANSFDGTLSRVDPKANAVVQAIPLTSAPSAVALGPRAVWVASKDDQTISRFDSRTGDLIARMPVGAAPRSLVFGAGSVWVADEKRGVVFRFDPARRAVVDTIAVGNGPAHVAFGYGSVWVANDLDGTVSRIDPARGAVTATIEVGDGPRGIAIGADGVWVSNEFDGTLALIDARANRVRRVLQVGGRPQGLAALDGRLFVAVRSAGNAHRGGTLRAIGTPPPRPISMDTVNLGAALQTLLTNDGLVGYRRVGGVDGSQLVPDLALAVPKPTDGGRTYTFRLRSGIRYSTGRLVQPADFRRAFKRGFLILGTEVYGSYYGGIIGASTCSAARARCDLSRGIAIDDRARTVTFHLRAADPDFLLKLALPIASAVPVDTPAKEATKHPLPATGPYMVARRGPGRRFTLVRNPRFHEWSKAAQPAGYPDRIVLTPAKSVTEAVRAVERGTHDFSLDGVPTELEHEVRTQYASRVHVNPVHGSTYLFLNTKVPPFDDVRVRRALNYAADRAGAVRVSARIAGGEPSCQILPPEFPGFRRYCPYTLHPGPPGQWEAPDLERARRLVADSGTSGAVVTVWVPDNHRGEGPLVAKLLRSLGYRPRLKRVGDRAYDHLRPGDERHRAQAGLMSWFADWPAASNFIDTFFSCRSPANWSEFCDRRIDARIRRAIALQTTDPYLANQLWAALDAAIVDQAPFVPLVTLKQIDIVSKRVGNYQFHPKWGVFLDQLWVR
jgi:peptide/nickel transport system substrate-binding protein